MLIAWTSINAEFNSPLPPHSNVYACLSSFCYVNKS